MAAKAIEHPSVGKRQAMGKEAGIRTPVLAHSGWQAAADRPDPVALLEAQDLTREPDLVPVRHGRMMVSPFTFYRGAAKIMAADLKDSPVAALDVQLCGDAHLSNFGVFASPERRLLFDLNDFDETLPGPFEYDVKRMAASFTIAARNNGFAKADTRAATMASVTAYREAMAEFALMPTMDIWYAHMDEDQLMTAVRGVVAAAAQGPKGKKAAGKAREQAKAAEKAGKTVEKTRRKAHTRDSLQALSKLGELVDGRYRIVSDPPVVVPARDLAAIYGLSPDEAEHGIREQFRAYRATLQDDRRRLLERFEIVDMARKVVGVGSVGTRAFIVLLEGRDARDLLPIENRWPRPIFVSALLGGMTVAWRSACWTCSAFTPTPSSRRGARCRSRPGDCTAQAGRRRAAGRGAPASPVATPVPAATAPPGKRDRKAAGAAGA